MILRVFTFILFGFLFNSCCRKGYCMETHTMPAIYFEFNTSNYNFTTKIYTLENNNVVDSTVFNYYYTGLQFAPYRQIETQGTNKRLYLIKHNSKTDTIYDVDCTFVPQQVTCSSCFLEGKQYVTNWSYKDLTFKHKNVTYSNSAVVQLEY